jgi:RNA polymerase sigma-70 factor, ECF subfamily
VTTEPADDFKDQLTKLLPNLRAVARSLSGNADRADDLVQETVMKAWRNRDSYTQGTNLKAWLIAILRNSFISDLRKRKREVQDSDGILASQVGVNGGQNGHVDLQDFMTALTKLPTDQREALILVGAEGLSYEEVALMCGCAVGTIKSRVNRARSRMCELMGVDGAQSFGEDQLSHRGDVRLG